MGEPLGIKVISSSIFERIPTISIVPFYLGFNPTVIPGCCLWLDGSTSTNFTFSSGSNISSWIDKSGSGNNALIQLGTPTFASNALNSMGAARITTRSTLYAPMAAGTFIRGMTFFIIYNMTSLGANPTLINRAFAHPNLVFELYNQGTNNNVHFLGNGAGSYNSGNGTDDRILKTLNSTSMYTTTIANNNNIWNYSYNGSTASVTVGTNMSDSGYTKVFIGTRSDNVTTMNGHFGEIIMYNTNLSTSNRQLVETYLAQKWGLVPLLPTTHPARTLRNNMIPNKYYTVTYSGGNTIVTFLASMDYTLRRSITATIMVIGGGGGGGSAYGGGGGGGGMVYSTGVVMAPGIYPVIVGNGGAAAGGTAAGNGANSSFNGLVGIGGGAGAVWPTASGSAGGCGGGGEGSQSGPGGVGSQGFNGSVGNGQNVGGGGGGGMGAAGATSRPNAGVINGFAGGIGLQRSITGTSVYYSGGGGGGGGNYGATNGGPGGLGGGGTGTGGTVTAAMAAGTDYLGGGGGGLGAGGKGVVIFSYPT